MKLLFELLKDSHRSDRELAKALGVSQPTITRMRSKLVSEGWIKEYTVIPDLEKIGFEIVAITCFKSKISKELIPLADKVTRSIPNIIFAARAQGMGKNAIMISLHKNYSDYAKLLSNLVQEYGNYIESHDTMIISLRDLIVKPLSLRYLADLHKE